MNSESPYYVTTNSGKLELTKGCYLTLMRRNNSVAKTLQKTKPISHSHRNNKRTLKKTYNCWKQKVHSSHQDIVLMTGKRNSQLVSRQFLIKPDR